MLQMFVKMAIKFEPELTQLTQPELANEPREKFKNLGIDNCDWK